MATEQRVFSAGNADSNPTVNSHGTRNYAHTRGFFDGIFISNLTQSSKLASDTFTAEDLRDAQVVAQVDTKFIACLLKYTSGSDRVLALIDQHAADERVRVERYLKRLCSSFLLGQVEVLELEPPRQVLLTRREAEVVSRPVMVNQLMKWGLWIEQQALASQRIVGVNAATQEFDFIQVDVIAVPDVVPRKVSELPGSAKAF